MEKLPEYFRSEKTFYKRIGKDNLLMIRENDIGILEGTSFIESQYKYFEVGYFKECTEMEFLGGFFTTCEKLKTLAGGK